MKSPIFKTKCTRVERAFVILLTLSLLILTIKTFYYSTPTLLSLSMYILITSVFSTLSFLAYFDFKKMEVHNLVSLILMITLVLINVILFFVLGSKEEITILNNWVYNPYNNIIATLILGSIFQLLVLASKEKALGQGDVRIAIITGLLIGVNNLIYWGYITVFSALIYGLILSYRNRKFKGLKIPFVPFMVLAIIVVLLIQI